MDFIRNFFSFTVGDLALSAILIRIMLALFLGSVISVSYMFSGKHSKNFVISLFILPALVAAVIIFVNDNIVASVSVMGVFNLVRFRSFPGTAREISVIFFAVASGLGVGLGFNLASIALTLILSGVLFLLCRTRFGERKNAPCSLRITIPEDLDYEEIFDDIFSKYTSQITLDQVKTTNLGTMFELRYTAVFKAGLRQKEFIDEIRCRNGNLTVICGRPNAAEEL